MKDTKDYKIATKLAHLSSRPEEYNGLVNTPVHRASTIIIKDFDGFQNCFQAPYRYGREGTPSSKAFEQAVATLDNAYNAIATSSGLAAIISVLNAYARPGKTLLLPDNFYGFSRGYCQETLAEFGVNCKYYTPMIDEEDLRAMIDDSVSLIYLESPGSLTYEVQDIGMFVKVAQEFNIPTACDNSWATPVNFKPLDHGIDISIISATKYISGHSDAMLGVVSCKDKETYERVLKTVRQSGNCPGSEEVYFGLRGLRTLDVRLARHAEAGLKLARWLQSHDAVKTVLHPALEGSAGHENWKKYFDGASGVFAVVLHEMDCKKIEKFLNNLNIFQMGFSWGGYESLIFPEQLSDWRISKPWDGDGYLMRVHAGLENMDDLQADLEQALNFLK